MSLYRPEDKKRLWQFPADETSDDTRTPFRRDYSRVIHSAVFRRLQGKTQLFPGNESDFFRNRLTHSLEVAQIARSIAQRLNSNHWFFSKGDNHIDLDLVETAALVHDLGHPPFGHNGESALNDCMKDAGGFEGNAQTLRILTRLEKKETRNDANEPISESGDDERLGLNLTCRTLAAALKYDTPLPNEANKGYYQTEAEVVAEIKRAVTSGYDGKIKTIECQIMDLADDIAYSTYDLEDALKAGFLHPLEMLNPSNVHEQANIHEQVAAKVLATIDRKRFTDGDVRKILGNIFNNMFSYAFGSQRKPDTVAGVENYALRVAFGLYDAARDLCSNGYVRTKLTSQLVGKFIRGVEVKAINRKFPALSKVTFNRSIQLQVEVLKQYTYLAVINSPRLSVVKYRGCDIVKEIFEALTEKDEDKHKQGYMMLPADCRRIYDAFEGNDHLQKRVICDFVAGMTDAHAIEFYGRLTSENPQTIFKPY